MTETAKHSGSLVVIGGAALISPSASDPLPGLPGTDAARIVLAEPDPQRGEALVRKLAGQRQVTVLPMLPGAAEGEAELAVHNLPGLRCLKPVQPALNALFPGLKLRKRLPVTLTRIETLLEKAGALPGPLALWIDLPGSEGDLLQALAGSDVLDRTQHLVLRGCDEGFFAGGSKPQALRAAAEKLGFSLLKTDESDTDFPVMSFRADLGARLVKTREAARKQVAELQAQLAQAHDGAKERQAALEERCKQANAALKAAEERAAALETARQEAEVKIAAQGKALGEARTAAEVHAKTLAERHAALKAAEERIAALKTARQEAEAKAQAELSRSNDLEQRLQLARNDLRRAEGQIEIIKDLLLREPGL